MPEPPDQDGPILVQTQAIGICGTDLEIIGGEYGSAPPGQGPPDHRHESLGRVAEAARGRIRRDLVVSASSARRDPVPCPACAAGHTGAGPIGLLAALLSVQRGHQTYVLNRVTEGRKPDMARRLGATYLHSGDLTEAAAEATSSSSAPATSSCCSTRNRATPATASSASPGSPRSAPKRSSTPDCSTGTWSCGTRSCSARQRQPGPLRTSRHGAGAGPTPGGSPT